MDAALLANNFDAIMHEEKTRGLLIYAIMVGAWQVWMGLLQMRNINIAHGFISWETIFWGHATLNCRIGKFDGQKPMQPKTSDTHFPIGPKSGELLTLNAAIVDLLLAICMTLFAANHGKKEHVSVMRELNCQREGLFTLQYYLLHLMKHTVGEEILEQMNNVYDTIIDGKPAR